MCRAPKPKQKMKHFLFQATHSAPQHKSKMGGGNFQILFWSTRAVNFSRALLLLFTLTAFFSCSKSDVANVAAPADREDMVSISKTEDGLLNVVITRDPSDPAMADQRDNECTFYEAMRFVYTSDVQGPDPLGGDQDNRVCVDVEFRLILIDKSTSARYPITSYTNGTAVTGLNITWVGYTPLSDFYYATEFNTCELSTSSGCTSTYSDDFWIVDFWGDTGSTFHLDPWSNWETIGAGIGGYTNANPDELYTQCTLNNDCSVSP